MKIKLIKSWLGSPVGTEITPTLNEVATRLIQRGIAVEVKEEKLKPETKKVHK